MRKLILNFGLLLTVSLATVVCNSCDKENDKKEETNKPTISDDINGLVINGVRWATRNVDTPGTFAVKPENAGMLYQWNRKKGWPATGDITGWNDTYPQGNTWERANDPSPAGWRVPTLDQIKTLFDADKVDNKWITINGVNGRVFTDKDTGNSIFLPAAGLRYGSVGTLGTVNSYGYYWSSLRYDLNDAYYLDFGSDVASCRNYANSSGFSVRAVAE